MKNLTTRKWGIPEEQTIKKRIYQNIEKKETENSGAVSPTFAIRIEKQSFSGIHRLKTLDFTGVDFQNGL